jgi:translation initiation factor IF-2
MITAIRETEIESTKRRIIKIEYWIEMRTEMILRLSLLPRRAFIQPKPVQVVEEEIKVISIPEILTIKELADKMKKPSAALIKKLFLSGKVVTLNQR